MSSRFIVCEIIDQTRTTEYLNNCLQIGAPVSHLLLLGNSNQWRTKTHIPGQSEFLLVLRDVVGYIFGQQFNCG